MSYLQDRKKERKRKKIFVSLFGVFLIIILSVGGVFSFMGGFFHFLGSFFWKAENTVFDSMESNVFLQSKKSVFKENMILKNENAKLVNKMLDYEILERENKDIKALFSRTENPNEFIIARVLVKPNKSPYDTLVIDLGKIDNLQKGQKVFAEPTIPLGEIVEIYNNTSLVKLYSSPDEITDAEIDIVGASVELLGRGGGNFEMTLPKNLSIPNGVAVIIPGLRMQILAIVAETVSDPKDPSNKIILKSPVNIEELKWVQVQK